MSPAALPLLLLQLAPGLEGLPRIATDVQAHYVSSYDRTGGNDDGFNGTYSALYVDAAGEHVIFDAKGPGMLLNLWFTSRVNGRSPLGFGRIKFYFDDEPEPRLDADANALFGGDRPPFRPPFAFHAFQSTGGYVSYLPMPFAKRLKITTERRVGFYNAYYHTYAADRDLRSWTGEEDLSAIERAWSRPGEPPDAAGSGEGLERVAGRVALPPPAMPDGELEPSTTVLLDRAGSGVVRALRVNPLFPLTQYQLQHVVLRIFWDGASVPAVDAPLGSFFGSGLGEASVRAVPLGMSPSGPYYCYLPMPFWRAVRIELVNENPEPVPEIWWEAEIGDNGYPERETGYFNARFNKEWPTTPGENYRILESAGRGTYVGQVMTVEPLRAELKRWWEGDLEIRLDGREYPSFHGTGHEDEYLGGWSNEWLMNPYSLPMHGEPKTEGLRQVDFQWSAATTMYRFFVAGIPFLNGISVSTEHGARNAATAMYSSVAYFYHRPDGLSKLGEADPSELGVEGGTTRFAFTLPPGTGYDGLRLRRRFVPAERQEAEVWLNGAFIGIWYWSAPDPHANRGDSDFIIPSSATRGASELRLEIRESGAAWSALGYELWGLRRP